MHSVKTKECKGGVPCTYGERGGSGGTCDPHPSILIMYAKRAPHLHGGRIQKTARWRVLAVSYSIGFHASSVQLLVQGDKIELDHREYVRRAVHDD